MPIIVGIVVVLAVVEAYVLFALLVLSLLLFLFADCLLFACSTSSRPHYS